MVLRDLGAACDRRPFHGRDQRLGQAPTTALARLTAAIRDE